MTRLSVGCGRKSQEPGLVRLDISQEVEPDVVWGLENFPYPFQDSTFSVIECIVLLSED